MTCQAGLHASPVAPSRRLFSYGRTLDGRRRDLRAEASGRTIIGAAGIGKTALVMLRFSSRPQSCGHPPARLGERAGRNLGIFEILLSREGIGTDLRLNGTVVIGDLFERRAEGGRSLVVVDNADLVDDHSSQCWPS